MTWGVNKSEKLGWTSPKSARIFVAAIFKMATTPVGQKVKFFKNFYVIHHLKGNLMVIHNYLNTWVSKTSQFFIYGPFLFSSSPTCQIRWACVVAHKMWNHSGMCLLMVITLKLISYFYIIAKTVEIWSKTGLSFFPLNA